MDPAELLTRLGGLAVRRELRVFDTQELAAAVAAGTIVRIARGHYGLPGPFEARAAARRASGVVSHLSAAQHWGWKVKFPPEQPVITVPRNRELTKAQRKGVDVRWSNLHKDDIRDGVTSPLRTVVDCARTEPFDAALAVADSALRAGAVTPRQIQVEAEASPRTGRPAAIRIANEADGRAANPFESALRAICKDVPGLDVEPQQWIERIGRVDLLCRRNNLVIEAESFEFHWEKDAFARDVARYTAFVRLGYAVVRFTWEEVMFRPEYVREVLTAMVALGPPWIRGRAS